MSKALKSQAKTAKYSKKQRAPEIGHSQDRLCKDRRFEQKLHPEPGISLCTQCTAISFDKHWYIDPERLKTLLSNRDVNHVLCPGCERVERKLYEGEVVLESNLLHQEKNSAMSLIKHTEGKAWHDNPMSRIASLHENGHRIEILTTTRWLAMRIGKQFYKSFKGNLEIKPCHREKFVRVYWSR